MVNISGVDLNLFLVFHAVIEEGSATRAARRLNVTQSAVSNALARLRSALDDPLFVRRGRGLVPTPRAEAMRAHVAAAVGHLEELLDHAFDPRTSTRTFTVAASDHHQAADLPRVVRAFGAALPRARLRVVSVDYLLATDGLATGHVDLVLAPEGLDDPGLHVVPLFRERAVIAVREGHPLDDDAPDLATLAGLRHIDVHLALGAPGHVNHHTRRGLDAIGFERDVALIVPSFTAAAMAAADSDLVAWLPEHAARLYLDLLPLRELRPPLPPFEIGCGLAWHDRTDADPGVRFVRELVCAQLRIGV